MKPEGRALLIGQRGDELLVLSASLCRQAIVDAIPLEKDRTERVVVVYVVAAMFVSREDCLWRYLSVNCFANESAQLFGRASSSDIRSQYSVSDSSDCVRLLSCCVWIVLLFERIEDLRRFGSRIDHDARRKESPFIEESLDEARHRDRGGNLVQSNMYHISVLNASGCTRSMTSLIFQIPEHIGRGRGEGQFRSGTIPEHSPTPRKEPRRRTVLVGPKPRR